MNKEISIIGCGWLGLPLGKSLAGEGYKVKGSTTQQHKLAHLQGAGIESHLVTLPHETATISDFLNTDILIIDIPPSNRKGQGSYEEQLRILSSEVVKAGIRKVLFISTTAVYPNLNREVVEAEADYIASPHSGTVMLHMEELFSKAPEFDTTVLRLGGLYGPDRHPGRFLAGKKGVKGGGNPVNMIHLEDCVGVIRAILDRDVWGEAFNACAPGHPSRKDFYTEASKAAGLVSPEFLAGDVTGHKIVSNHKLVKVTGYQFRHPDPLKSLGAEPFGC